MLQRPKMRRSPNLPAFSFCSSSSIIFSWSFLLRRLLLLLLLFVSCTRVTKFISLTMVVPGITVQNRGLKHHSFHFIFCNPTKTFSFPPIVLFLHVHVSIFSFFLSFFSLLFSNPVSLSPELCLCLNVSFSRKEKTRGRQT